MKALVGLLGVLLGSVVVFSAAEPCATCPLANYWTVPLPQSACHTTEDVPCFPETDLLLGRANLGAAFMGGGTRSATMTVGQLRGLQQIELLDKLRYVSAVSGGAWAAVPFTYSKLPLEELLGRYEEPSALQRERVVQQPNGYMAKAIADSSLLAGSFQEVAGDLSQFGAEKLGSQLISSAVSALNGLLRREPTRLNKTYSRLIGRAFIDPLVEPNDGAPSARLFSWTSEVGDQISSLNHGRLEGNMVLVPPHRPFLIAGATLISARRDYEYPLLMPLEFTPLYVGIRHRFGRRFGGTYVSPWAYDSTMIGQVGREDSHCATPASWCTDQVIRVKYDANRKFTLADVAASTGAAPQLPVMIASFVPEKFRSTFQGFARVFPAFSHFTINETAVDGQPPTDRGIRTALTEEIGHGDGGFTDNLGLLALLARGVRNVLVFINTNTECAENNDDLKALFEPVGPPAGSGDKTHNVVFRRELHAYLVGKLIERRNQHKAQIFCERDWEVLPNAQYEIAGFKGLNACWFYNSGSQDWMKQLPDQLQEMVGGHDQTDAGKNFDHFPWLGTFFQNKPRVIQLRVPQVNLLSNLTAWIVANQDTRTMIRSTLDY